MRGSFIKYWKLPKQQDPPPLNDTAKLARQKVNYVPARYLSFLILLDSFFIIVLHPDK